MKSFIQAIQTLRDLGVKILGLSLPKIVVVKDQSIGKSSFIEGISEIKVSCHVGTCTRCPLETNLVEDSEIHAQWIRKRKKAQGYPVAWRSKVTESKIVKTIS